MSDLMVRAMLSELRDIILHDLYYDIGRAANELQNDILKGRSGLTAGHCYLLRGLEELSQRLLENHKL